MARLLCAVLLLFALFPCLALAEGGGHGDGHESPGLLEINPGLGFWTVVTFVLLMLVLRKFAWGPIVQGLNERENTIRSSIENAKQAEEKAAALLKEYEQKLADAEDRVKALIEEGRNKTKQETQKMIEEATKECQHLRENTKKEMQAAKKQAVKDLFRLSAELSVSISSKIIGKSLQQDDHQKTIEKAIDEFKGVELQKYVN